MEFYEPRNREALIPALVTVWEASVRETHRFLSPAEIAAIRPQVPEALEAAEHLLIAQEIARARPLAFWERNRAAWKCFSWPRQPEGRAWAGSSWGWGSGGTRSVR